MGPGGFFPTNPDLADVLGRTDFDFGIFFWDLLGPNLGSGLGPAWAQLGKIVSISGNSQLSRELHASNILSTYCPTSGG